MISVISNSFLISLIWNVEFYILFESKISFIQFLINQFDVLFHVLLKLRKGSYDMAPV